MSKGEITRQTILRHATELATKVGLEGLSIGRLAEDLELSKSGLFAHFGSKEALRVEVLKYAEERFVEAVVKPALAAPRGLPRLRAIFDRWLSWPSAVRSPRLVGKEAKEIKETAEQARDRSLGCLFVAAAVELDDRPGPARDHLVKQQRDWLDLIAGTARSAIAEGHFREDVDPEQLAHDLYSVMLGYHHAARLLKDPLAPRRAAAAFEALLTAAAAGRSAPGPPGLNAAAAAPHRVARSASR